MGVGKYAHSTTAPPGKFGVVSYSHIVARFADTGVPHQSGAAESTLTERLVRDLMHLKQDSLDS